MATTSWTCTVCGYTHKGSAPPDTCPVCGAPVSVFEPDAGGAPDGSRRFVCTVCAYAHEGDGPPDACPVCGAGADLFEPEGAGAAEAGEEEPVAESGEGEEAGEYLAAWARSSDDFEVKFGRIVNLAKTGESEISPMRTQKRFPEWDTVLFKGAQLMRQPLEGDEPVSTKTVIGAGAKSPLELAVPMYVSHMSFGALSREAKIALAKGSTLVGTAMCSGEGGMLPEERENASKYIYELGTAAFSHVDDAIRAADAVELKIGQAAKPGLGGHLPAGKVTEEIAKIRGLQPGEASISPARYTGVGGRDDLKREVARVRELTDGKPVGIKITAGHIEGDLDVVLHAEPDFVTIDCRGGATGAAPTFVKDNVCLPPIFAIHRARWYLDRAGSRVTLCVTGGFRDSTDIAKALALGADAVALATASLVAIGCQQYRVCHTGNCPVGITTQDPGLRSRFDVEASVERFVNFYEATRRELEVLTRINGRSDVHDLDRSDIFTISNEVARNTGLEHA